MHGGAQTEEWEKLSYANIQELGRSSCATTSLYLRLETLAKTRTREQEQRHSWGLFWAKILPGFIRVSSQPRVDVIVRDWLTMQVVAHKESKLRHEVGLKVHESTT